MVKITEIPSTIRETFEEFRYGEHVTPVEINKGECKAFAKSVKQKLEDTVEIKTTTQIAPSNESKPEPWHVWLTDGDKHYDAEHPEGVETWSKLNFFKRTLKKEPNI